MIKESGYTEINKKDREKLISILTDELLVLHAKIELSQSEISKIVGMSRQTYSSVETKKRMMSWASFLSLVLFFVHNEKTRSIFIVIDAFPEQLEKMFKVAMVF